MLKHTIFVHVTVLTRGVVNAVTPFKNSKFLIVWDIRSNSSQRGCLKLFARILILSKVFCVSLLPDRPLHQIDHRYLLAVLCGRVVYSTFNYSMAHARLSRVTLVGTHCTLQMTVVPTWALNYFSYFYTNDTATTKTSATPKSRTSTSLLHCT